LEGKYEKFYVDRTKLIMDRKDKISFLNDIIRHSEIHSSYDACLNGLSRLVVDKSKASFLKDIIKFSEIFPSLDAFLDGLKRLKQDIIEADEKETCKSSITQVLVLMNGVQPGMDIHTFNKAKMYLGIEHKKGTEESFLAYLTKIAIETKDYSRLKKHMSNLW